ncbi:Sperm-associated antigen 16 protein, partial [Merops nubicus]
VPTDDELRLEKDVEDLLEAWQISQKQAEDAPIFVCQAVQTSEKPVLETDEAVDDVFCRFLDRLGMSRTLNCFQAEWHEFIEKGVIKTEDTGLVPTVLVHNQQLEDENMLLRKELGNYKLALSKAKETMVKLHRERNFHRMRHDQLIQEKKRFICDVKRLRAHCAELNQLAETYETVPKQKKVISLQRDRVVGQVKPRQMPLAKL